MTNVIHLTVPSRIAPLEARITALLGAFAEHRRIGDDVFWLKENAELLNILECTGQSVAPEALARHAGFYAQALQRLQFFPQYYRFLLSLSLDLEDLGMPGDQAQRMVDFAAREGLAEAELSDLQRAEARRLMTRRGVDPIRDDGLNDRLRAFCARTKTFALPNKKAAYELTHIVYYLSEYGRRDPDLPEAALQSLHFAGLTAFLDQNADLLAEICIALRYAGQQPPAVWTSWLEQETAAYRVHEESQGSINDDYHEFLVCNWHQAVIEAADKRGCRSEVVAEFEALAGDVLPRVPQVLARNMVVPVTPRAGGPAFTATGNPVKMSSLPEMTSRPPASALDGDRKAILDWLDRG